MKNRLTLLLALFFCTGWALHLAAQGITVTPGTYFAIDSGTSVTVAGSLASSGTVVNSGTLNVSGNWSNTGTAAVAGTVNLSSDNLAVSGQTIFTTTNLNDSSGAQQIVTDANAGSTPSDFGNLTVSSTNGVSLGSNLYASQSLALGSELLTTNAYSMDLGAGATTSNGTGYVLGNLQKAFNTGAQTFNFIVGTANGYSPATVAFNNITTAGKLTVNAAQTFEPNVPVPSEALDRYWTSAVANGLAYDHFDITLNYLSVDFNGSPFVQATMESSMRGAAFDPTLNYPAVGTRVADDGPTGSIQLLNITNVGDFTTVAPCTSCANTWLGNNTNWSDNTNWSSGTAPASCADSVVIPSGTGNDPIISGATSVGNISFTEGNSATSVTIQVNGVLSICGNVTAGSGLSTTFDGSSNVALTGSTAQTLSGKLTFETLVVNNTSGGVSVATGATVNISTALNLQSGNFDATNGTVTLTSTSSSQEGILNDFSTNYTGTYSGNIAVQRYFDASLYAAQHLIGAPVSANMSQLSPTGTGGYIIDHDCDETQTDHTSPYGNLFSYNEAHGGVVDGGATQACEIQSWYVETSGTNAFNPAQGYSYRQIGAGTIQLQGAPNLASSYSFNTVYNGGTQSSLTNGNFQNSTLQNRTMYSGYNLAANPYPAPLSISDNSQEEAVAAGFGANVYVFATEGANQGRYIATTTVAPFQAFMINRTDPGSGGTYTINGSDRVTTSPGFYRQANNNQLVMTSTNTSTGLIDQTTVAFNSASTTGYDPLYDAFKIPGSLNRHTMYTVNNDRWMDINTLPSIQETGTIAMGFEPGVSGTYNLTFDGISSFDPTSYIMLEDQQTNTMYNVRNGAYSFTSNATDNWNRFVLHFTPPAAISTSDATCSEPGMIQVQQPGTANWNYTVTNASSILLSSGTLNANSPLMVSATAGVYTLTLTDNNGYTVVKNIQVNGQQAISASIAASATTAQQNQLITLAATADNASTFNWNFGDGASATGPVVTHSYTNEGTYTIILDVLDPSGCSSQTTQMISVTPGSATGVPALSSDGRISIWSNTDLLYVDFTKMSEVNATIDVYDVLGQKMFSDKYTDNTVYMKQITNIEVGYIIVRVINNDEIITKKVLISNDK